MVPNQRSQEPARSARALTRRSLFEFAGLALLSAALPSDATLARPPSEQDQPPSSPATSPIMEKLSSYMSQAGTRPLPEEVVEKAKHHILDTYDVRFRITARPRGFAVCASVRWKRGRNRSRFKNSVRTPRSCICQWRPRPFR